MKKLPALNSIKQCPKCKLDSNSKDYREPFKYKYYSDVRVLVELLNTDIVTTQPSSTRYKNVMQRICVRCSYVWFEQCVDALSQGESTSDKNHTTNATNNYPPLFSNQHFQDTNKIGETLINSLKEKGFTKSSSTKCPASQDLFNLNHTRINLYCSLPRGHNGQHQITLQDNNRQLLEWKWSDDSFDTSTVVIDASKQTDIKNTSSDFNIEQEKDKAMEQSAIVIQGLSKETKGKPGSTILNTNESLNTTDLIPALNKAKVIFANQKDQRSEDCSIILNRLKTFTSVSRGNIDLGNELVKEAKELLLKKTQNEITLEGNYSECGSMAGDD